MSVSPRPVRPPGLMALAIMTLVSILAVGVPGTPAGAFTLPKDSHVGLPPDSVPNDGTFTGEGSGIYIMVQDKREVGNANDPDSIVCAVDIAVYNLTVDDVAELVLQVTYLGPNGERMTSLTRFQDLRTDLPHIDLLNRSTVPNCRNLSISAVPLLCRTADNFDCRDQVKGIRSGTFKPVDVM